MRRLSLFVCCLMLLVLCGCKTSVDSQEVAAPLELKVAQKLPLTAALYLPPEFRDYTYEMVTSPFDSLALELGASMTGILTTNMPDVFERVVMAESKTVPEGADVLIIPTVLDHKNIIPFPAYEPHRASMVCRVEVLDKTGEPFFTQTASGDAQTGGNLFSGFSSQSLAIEASQLAAKDAMRQVLQGLAESVELKELAAP